MISEHSYTFEDIQKAVRSLPDPNDCPHDRIAVALQPPLESILANESLGSIIQTFELRFYREPDDELSNHKKTRIYKWVLKTKFKIVN